MWPFSLCHYQWYGGFSQPFKSKSSNICSHFRRHKTKPRVLSVLVGPVMKKKMAGLASDIGSLGIPNDS